MLRHAADRRHCCHHPEIAALRTWPAARVRARLADPRRDVQRGISLPMNSDSPVPPPRPKPPGAGGTALGATAGLATYFIVGWISLAGLRGNITLLVLLLIVAVVLAVRGIWRGFALGVFIGAGLSLLLIGACIAMWR